MNRLFSVLRALMWGGGIAFIVVSVKGFTEHSMATDLIAVIAGLLILMAGIFLVDEVQDAVTPRRGSNGSGARSHREDVHE